MKVRTLVFAFAMAVVFALPTPARAAPDSAVAADLVEQASRRTARAHGRRPRARWSRSTPATSVRSMCGGRTRWQTKVDGVSEGAPATDHDLVLVGAAGRVVALSRADGTIRWEQPLGDEVTSVALGDRFAVAGDGSGTFRVSTRSTGTVRWSHALRRHPVVGAPHRPRGLGRRRGLERTTVARRTRLRARDGRAALGASRRPLHGRAGGEWRARVRRRWATANSALRSVGTTSSRGTSTGW